MQCKNAPVRMLRDLEHNDGDAVIRQDRYRKENVVKERKKLALGKRMTEIFGKQ